MLPISIPSPATKFLMIPFTNKPSVLLWVGVVSFWLIATSTAQAADPPNIIIVLADDLGYSDLGCYGGEIHTPNIDSLAKNGAKFTQVYNSARCCPSRASLMTGLYPSQAGIGDFTTGQPSKTRGPGYLGRLNNQCATLAEVLRPAGYSCYYVGKWHMHPETGPIRRGFDEFYGYTNDHSHDQYDADYYFRLPKDRKKEIDPPADKFYATDVFNDYALEFIRQGQQRKEEEGKPWFLFLGHSSPHFPVQAPAERADKYDATYSQGWDKLREKRFERMKTLGIVNGKHWQLPPRALVPVDGDAIANGYPGKTNPAWDALDKDRQADLARRMAVFAAMVEGVDNGVGEIVEHLNKTGDLDNTLIIFLSDNGACYEWGPFGFDGRSRRGETILRTGDELQKTGTRGTHQSYGSGWANLGNTPLRLYKHFTHEGGISTPFIAHWPAGIGRTEGWIREPAHVMDIMPTLLDVTGAKYPEKLGDEKVAPFEGTSLLPAMQGKELPKRSIGFDHQGAHALRKGDWKLVWAKRMPTEIKWELYNLAEDRCELNDLADKYPERVAAMAAEWDTWARRVGVIWEEEQIGQQELVSPKIAGQPVTITGRVKRTGKQGVVLAQGGRECGYAVHLLDSQLCFDVHVGGKVSRIVTKESLPQEFHFTAVLSATTFSLQVNEGEISSDESPGLIPLQPKDPLSIARDDLTAAGNYTAPNPLQGTVSELVITAGEDVVKP
jgi:arylsulfatase A-like enzyme